MSFVRPELCHSASSASDFEALEAHPAFSELFGLLNTCAASESEWSSATAEMVDDIYTKFLSFSYFCSEELSLLWDCNKDRLLLNDLVARHKNLLAEQEIRISSQHKQINVLEQAIGELEQNLKEQEQNLQSMTNSLSWKMSGPARWLHSKMTRTNRPGREQK